MVEKINHTELEMLIRHYYEKKLPLFIWGRMGIGKSALIRKTAEAIALKKGKIFFDWNKGTLEEKQKVFNNPEKYFVLIDIRLSEWDSTDIKGLPIFNDDKRSIDFKVPFWALLLEKPESDGVLFFDEINLAVPLVISSVYKIVYDRIINSSRINDNWLILGAGNISEDRAYTHDIAPPMRDRGGEVELIGANIDCWGKWAIENGIDSRIIGFLNFKNSNLFKVDFEDEQKPTTYRGWERLNKLIDGVKDWAEMNILCSSAIGEGVAKEYVAFCKISEKIKLEDLIKKPEKIKDIEDISIKYFLVSAVADKYKDKKIDFAKVMEISEVFDKCNNAEFVALLWRLCYGMSKEFKEEFIKKCKTSLANKYAKYII
jgi:hypothetical protein